MMYDTKEKIGTKIFNQRLTYVTIRIQKKRQLKSKHSYSYDIVRHQTYYICKKCEQQSLCKFCCNKQQITINIKTNYISCLAKIKIKRYF